MNSFRKKAAKATSPAMRTREAVRTCLVFIMSLEHSLRGKAMAGEEHPGIPQGRASRRLVDRNEINGECVQVKRGLFLHFLADFPPVHMMGKQGSGTGRCHESIRAV